jgi:hypothetical protein
MDGGGLAMFLLGIGMPLHGVQAQGYPAVTTFADLERVAEVARRLNRYEFLFTASPVRIDKGMGSPLNPIATF